MGWSSRIALAAGMMSVGGLSQAAAQPVLTEKTEKAEIVVERVAQGLSRPWGLAFLPDGRMLVTEKAGRLRLVTPEGALSQPLTGTPTVSPEGQGGLLDVALDPDFAANRLVYLTYAEPRDGGNGTTAARGRLNEAGTGLENLTVIFRQEPTYAGSLHYGSRLAFAPDGTLFVTTGERFQLRDKAQELSTHLGKVIRIRPDGSVPPDNPFVGRADAKPEVWSYGHRNIQAAAINPASRELWTVEHGARGGDEVNIPRKGLNYGWPVISFGVNYEGTKIGVGTKKEGMEQPVFYWDPSIAPSGMAFYTGDKFPEWRNSVFVGALAKQHLNRLETAGGRVVKEERLLAGLNVRIRDVRQGPDGFLYLLTDQDQGAGRILRVRPK